MRSLIATTLVMLSLSAATVAQSRFCIGGELDRLTPTQLEACKAKSVRLRQEAKVLGTAGDWRFILVCDEPGWRDYASLTGRHSKELLQAAEGTDRRLGLTFIRASRLASDDVQNMDLVLTSAGQEMPGNHDEKHAVPMKSAIVHPVLAKLKMP